MPLDSKYLEAFLNKVGGLQLSPLEMVFGGWRFTPESRDGSDWGGGGWQYEDTHGEDWRTPLRLMQRTMYTWEETTELVDAVHAATKADISHIRGSLPELATAFLENVESGQNQKLIETLTEEFYDLFALGLPARFTSIVTGIEVSGNFSPAEDVLIRPILSEDWPAHLDPGQSLTSIYIPRCTVLELQGRLTALGQSFDPSDEKFYHWQKRREQVLRILRLYRVGGIVSHVTNTIPTTLLRSRVHTGFLSEADQPPSVSSFKYLLTAEDEGPLEAHFEFLRSLPPWKHDNLTPVDIALDRYESALGSTKFPQETLLYAIMGLEALMHREREGRQALTNRVALLMDLAGFGDPLAISRTVDTAYRFRNPLVHGENVRRTDVPILTTLLMPILDYLRASILLLTGLKISKGTLLRRTDHAMLVPSDRARLSDEVASLADRIQLRPSSDSWSSRET